VDCKGGKLPYPPCHCEEPHGPAQRARRSNLVAFALPPGLATSLLLRLWRIAMTKRANGFPGNDSRLLTTNSGLKNKGIPPPNAGTRVPRVLKPLTNDPHAEKATNTGKLIGICRGGFVPRHDVIVND
jgi:hypothetical protein